MPWLPLQLSQFLDYACLSGYFIVSVFSRSFQKTSAQLTIRARVLIYMLVIYSFQRYGA